MDTYNKSVQHNWFHHATWGSSKYKSEGVGKVLWHSLTESGEVEIVNIQFGKKVYEGVSVKHLNPVKIQEHSHEPKRTGKELDDKKKKKKKMKENMIKLKDMLNESNVWDRKFGEALPTLKLEQDEPDHFGSGKNIDVFGYDTENFDICKSAVLLFQKLSDAKMESTQEHIIKAAEHLDKFFGIEKDVVSKNSTSDEQGDKAIELLSLFSYEIGDVSARMKKDLTREIAFIGVHMDEIGKRM